MYSIVETKKALTSGCNFATPYCKTWHKYSVIENKSNLVLLTSPTRYNAEDFILYLENKIEAPDFYKEKVLKNWSDE